MNVPLEPQRLEDQLKSVFVTKESVLDCKSLISTNSFTKMMINYSRNKFKKTVVDEINSLRKYFRKSA